MDGPGPLAAVAVAAVAALLIARPVPCPAQPLPLAPDWTAAVERYAAGDRTGAVAAAVRISERGLREQVEAIRALAERARACPGCVEATGWRKLALGAALMLHTDAYLEERKRDANGAPAHEFAAVGIAGLLLDDPERRGFVRRWYATTAELELADNRWEDALERSRRGLDAFPGAAELLLVIGTVEEGWAAQGAWRDPSSILDPSTRQTRENLARFREQRSRLERARDALAQAVAHQPALDAARLRLGRVAWRLGDAAAARAALEEVLSRTGARGTAYLAYLFLGRLHQDAGRHGDAARSYAAAVAIDGSGQAARVALSHARLRLGDAAAARRELLAGLALAGQRQQADPFWDYPWGSGAGAGERLEALRREVSR